MDYMSLRRALLDIEIGQIVEGIHGARHGRSKVISVSPQQFRTEDPKGKVRRWSKSGGRCIGGLGRIEKVLSEKQSLSEDAGRIEEAMNQLVAAIHSGGSETITLAAVVGYKEGGLHVIASGDNDATTRAIMFLNYAQVKHAIEQAEKELAKQEDPEAHYD